MLIQLQMKNILEWTDLETQQWFTLKKWSTHFQALGEPDGDTLARMSLADMNDYCIEGKDARRILKAVEGVINLQKREKVLDDPVFEELQGRRGI